MGISILPSATPACGEPAWREGTAESLLSPLQAKSVSNESIESSLDNGVDEGRIGEESKKMMNPTIKIKTRMMGVIHHALLCTINQ